VKEKRQFKRRQILIDVSCDIQAGAKGIGSSTKDISAGGICLVSKELFEVDNIMEFRFVIPDTEKAIQITGKVMWIEKSSVHTDRFYYSGIEFMDIDDIDRDLIAKFVDGETFLGE
jgi:c-di-GMP-binding flagellar brake protein YcgR